MKGRNGYLYVGREDGEAIYEKDGKLYRGKDLVEMDEAEQQKWERERAEFIVKQDKYMGI